jgi:hypothetical protein
MRFWWRILFVLIFPIQLFQSHEYILLRICCRLMQWCSTLFLQRDVTTFSISLWNFNSFLVCSWIWIAWIFWYWLSWLWWKIFFGKLVFSRHVLIFFSGWIHSEVHLALERWNWIAGEIVLNKYFDIWSFFYGMKMDLIVSFFNPKFVFQIQDS